MINLLSLSSKFPPSLSCFMILWLYPVDISLWLGSRTLGLVNSGPWRNLIRPQWWEDTSVLGSGSSWLLSLLLFYSLVWEPRSPERIAAVPSGHSLPTGSFLSSFGLCTSLDHDKKLQYDHILKQWWTASTDQHLPTICLPSLSLEIVATLLYLLLQVPLYPSFMLFQ